MNREEWVNKGFVDEPVDKSIDLKAAINELKKEKNAVILGHYYQKGEIQDIADYIGDSLALAQIAAKTDADILVAFILWEKPQRCFVRTRRCWCPT